MSKIYSRPRLKLPRFIFYKRKPFNNNYKYNNLQSHKHKTLVLIIIIAFITVKLILDTINPIFNKLCENKAMSLATIISNNKATEVMKNHTYDELFTIEKDENGNVSFLKANVVPINEITSDIAVKIQEEINKQGRDNIEIALGNFTGIKYFSGVGPGIKITISTVGNVKTDLKSEFSAQGINQTLHRVYLKVDFEVSILTPFNTIERNITNQVLIAENIIVGHIPDTYYNLEGLSQDDVMEVMQ